MKKIEVYYSGWGEHWHLGTLADNGRNILFEYSTEALKQGLELSPLHLQLRIQAYGNFPEYLHRLPGLIADALPDGWGLLLMDRIFKKRGLSLPNISPLDRLSYLGSNAMGALTFHPPIPNSELTSDVNLKFVAQEVYKIITGHPTKALQEIAVIGGSPHGARPKALLRFDKKQKHISNDSSNKGEPWLFKFPAERDHKEVCAIEYLYSKLARACGIHMTDCEYFDLGKNLSAFGTKRFDVSDAYRVPIHTAAGVLNADFRIPSLDYVSLLRLIRQMTRDQREVDAGFLQCVFNTIFNNRDDHIKNFSFILDQKRNWKLSPAYDLTFNSGLRGEHQMDICGEAKNPRREHLMKLAELSGVTPRKAKDSIDKVRDIASRLKVFIKDTPIRKQTMNQIFSAIKANLSGLS